MAKKSRVRVTEANLDKARKKIRSTPKRGRWPKYDQIHPCDLNDYIEGFQYPSKVFLHPKYGNACFRKKGYRGPGSIDPHFKVELPEEYDIIGTVRFYCESFDPKSSVPIIDTVCMSRCERISCPYYKKGFITVTLKEKTFDEDVNAELDKRHNKKQDSKNT